MITIFNRKELLVTYDMNKQSDIRTILNSHNIEYKVKVFNTLGSSLTNSRTRGRRSNTNIDLTKTYEYKIYVKRNDYDKAMHLINTES